MSNARKKPQATAIVPVPATAPSEDNSDVIPTGSAGATEALAVFSADELEDGPGLVTSEPERYAESNPKLLELVESMRAHAATHPESVGNNQPVAVHLRPEGRHWIVAGRRRRKAAEIAGTNLLAVVKVWDERSARIVAATENIHREDISPLAEAWQYRDLMASCGMSEREVAAEVGKSQSHVNKRVSLLRLPDWAQGAIRSGEVTPSVAYDGMGRFLSIPEPAAAQMWEGLAKRWPEMKRTGALTAQRIRDELATLAKKLSRTLDPTLGYHGEPMPLFDLDAHDAACTCGRPEIKLHDYLKPHPRCYDLAAWTTCQAAVRAARAPTESTPQAQPDASASTPADVAAPVDVPAPATVDDSGPAAGETTQGEVAGDALPSTDPDPLQPVRRFRELTWAEFTAAYGPDCHDLAVTGDALPEEFAQVEAPPIAWNTLSPEKFMFVGSPRWRDLFRLVYTDREDLTRARAWFEQVIHTRTARMREQDAAGIREAAAKVDLRHPETLAAILSGMGNCRYDFVQVLARSVGLIPADAHLTADALAEMPKKDITILAQAAALTLLQGKQDEDRHNNAPFAARREVTAEVRQDYLSLLGTLQPPQLVPAAQVQDAAFRVDELVAWLRSEVSVHETEPGVFADLVSMHAEEWNATLRQLAEGVDEVRKLAGTHGVSLDVIPCTDGQTSVEALLIAADTILSGPVAARIRSEAGADAPAAIDTGHADEAIATRMEADETEAEARPVEADDSGTGERLAASDEAHGKPESTADAPDASDDSADTENARDSAASEPKSRKRGSAERKHQRSRTRAA